MFFLLALATCGPREAEIERPDEVVLAQEEEPRGISLFRRDREPDRLVAEIIYGELVPEVLSLRLDRTADGVIIIATARVGASPAYDVSLRPTNNGLPDADGFLSFEFRYDIASELRAPIIDAELTSARFVPLGFLENARGIRVYAAENNRTIRQ